MNRKQAAQHVFHVAKMAGGSAEHAFDLRRRDDGGIGISNVKIPLSAAERTLLFAHFGASLVARDGTLKDGMFVEHLTPREPGTPEHFLAAVHRLPPPFTLIAVEN